MSSGRPALGATVEAVERPEAHDRRGPSRRGVIVSVGAGLMTAGASYPVAASPSRIDVGEVQDGKVKFPNWRGEADKPSSPPPAPKPPSERVGFAIVGLGRLSLEEILPAFGQTKRAKPVALVSGSPDKATAVAAQYGIRSEALYDYASFDRIVENSDIEAVYVVLPNGMHREFVERAARAGKHVLTEKPMATSSAEARVMIAACETAGVKLMVAYRCQYEPYNREAIRLYRSGELGRGRIIQAANTQTMGPAEQWRFDKALAGGGALPDIGLYCLNGARALTGEEPIEVFASTYSPPGDPRYAEVEETISFVARFPSGVVAECSASYGAHEHKDLRVHLEKGTIDLKRAFAYEGQELRVASRDGKAESERRLTLGQKNQFALEIDHMAECVRENRRPRTPGEEGLQDHVLMEAIYRSANERRPIPLEPVEKPDATRGPDLPDSN